MSVHLPAHTGMNSVSTYRRDQSAIRPGLVRGSKATEPDDGKVLVLDGNTRSALAATRSLGQKGLHVVVAEDRRTSLAGQSKYCSETFSYPSANKYPEAFINSVREETERRGIGVIFPMAEVSTALLLNNRDQFGKAKLPFVDFAAFDALSDKRKLMEVAQRLNVRVPHTEVVPSRKALKNFYPKLQFPVVLKPFRSKILSNGKWITASVRYANSIQELEETVEKQECFREHPFLAQHYIPGHAHGIFALYDHGRPLVFFAHRRLREKPQTGGVSVLSESAEPNPEALRMAKAVLNEVGWHGVAMVEFKITPSGIPYLMEVNGRFWGSLQLAIDAGVDFPWLLYQMATEQVIYQENDYEVGVRSRWLLGDLASVAKAMVQNGHRSGLPSTGGRLRSLMQFLGSFRNRSRNDVCRWSDLKPFFAELRQSLRH